MIHINNTKKLKQYLINTIYFVATIVILLSLVRVLGTKPRECNKVTFLDVGQGDCILLQLQSGENYLFDCGSLSRNKVGEKVLLPFLKYHGISVLDAVFVSHVDQDHMNGILELCDFAEKEHIQVKQLIFSGERAKEDFFALGSDAVASKSWCTGRICAGMKWSVGEVVFECINPPEETVNSLAKEQWESNESALGFLVTFRGPGKDILLILASDVEGRGEAAMLERLQTKMQDAMPYVILKVAHHGSKYSTDEALLNCIRPKLAVISSGKGNSYGHPHQEVIERLKAYDCQVLRTDEEGAITLSIYRDKVKISTALTKQRQ